MTEQKLTKEQIEEIRAWAAKWPDHHERKLSVAALCDLALSALTPARDGGLERLIARLKNAQHRVGQMCKERRPPKMRIPATPDDDDLFICDAITDAIAAFSRPLRAAASGMVMVPRDLLEHAINGLYRKDNFDSHSLAGELEQLAKEKS